MPDDIVFNQLLEKGVSRRDFIKACSMLAGVMGVNFSYSEILDMPEETRLELIKPVEKLVVQALQSEMRVPVIWLEFQDCAGCSEALTRSHSPTLGNLVLNKITVEYHETLSAAAGFQAEDAKQMAMEKYAGQYVLVVEGSVPEEGNGYCTIGGQSAVSILEEAAKGAAAIVATGNCAAFGGLPKANPNPTGAKGVMELVKGKTVVNIPGCPAIPEVFTGTLLHFLVFGALPELDALNRPKTFYGVTIHDRCLRRPFYEAGKFAASFDDEGAKKGYCLYKLGCKGPTTYNACASMKWDGGLSFPVQSGHPCLGCSEPDFWDGGGFYQGQSAPIDRPHITSVGAAAAAGVALGVGVASANNAQKKKMKLEDEKARD